MIEILEFVFASPWRFAGSVVLLAVAGWSFPALVTITRRDD